MTHFPQAPDVLARPVIELPSWVFSNAGTRCMVVSTPRNVEGKPAGAAPVHALTWPGA